MVTTPAAATQHSEAYVDVTRASAPKKRLIAVRLPKNPTELEIQEFVDRLNGVPPTEAPRDGNLEP
jgi:hypothetical protein